jgi:CheY-like chemotaxis protein
MRQRHILVVEDSDEDFATVQDAAQQIAMPHSLVRASSGTECLRLLRQYHEDQCCREALPLMVLLDLSTPGDDGREVLLQVRSSAELGTSPVVVFSASANPRDLNFCYANGANAYHVKPVLHAKHLMLLHEIFGYWLCSVSLPH